MQVTATAQAFPVWQNGYRPEPVSRGSALSSAVFAPLSQPQAATAGSIGGPQDRPGSKSGNGKSTSDAGANGTGGEATAVASDAANSTPGTRVNRKSQGQGNGQEQGRQKAVPGQPSGPDGKPLTQFQQAEIRALQSRNRDVTAHEQAHEAAGGGLAGAISYTYERGPNGKLYAIGGEVPISIKQDPNNPQKTVAQMRQVIAAALAPVDPSAQDRAVAARAAQILLSAQRALSSQATSQAKSAASNVVAASSSEGASKNAPGQTAITPFPASGGQSPVRLYTDVAQLGGTPHLNSGTHLGLNATA